MTNRLQSRTVLVALTCAAITPVVAQNVNEPYRVSVWATVTYGPDGKPNAISIVDEASYPKAFADNVRERFAATRVPPPRVDGERATLRSGVELRFIVTPTDNGGTVRMDGVSIGPMPTKKYLASYPKDIRRSRGWQGEVTGICTVSVEGRCSSIEVVALPGMPESVRRFAKASLEGWEFEPQQVNGKPIEGEYRMRTRLNSQEIVPENFKRDKFLRILHGR
jgi:hypothetical protein